MKNSLLILLSFATVIAGVLFLSEENDPYQFGRRSDSSTLPASIESSLSQERRRLLERIRRIGSKKAYEDFKREYATQPFTTQHAAAHLIGELLYETEGIRGLTICDEAFAFGCYHSFFARAIAENGIGLVEELDRACLEAHEVGTGCQHGIGHGILQYLGRGKLVEALEVCKRTVRKSTIFGCTQGVFMEYNVPIIIAPEKIYSDVRKPKKENPYDPCDTVVQAEFQESCYHEMPEWWNHIYDGDFDRIGKLCGAIGQRKNREACFFGAGNIAASKTRYDLESTLTLCQKMPSENGKALCRIGASWRFGGLGGGSTERVRQLCEGITGISGWECWQNGL